MSQPDTNYSASLRFAIIALSKDELDTAMVHATRAMNVALYQLMEPVGSVYVTEAQSIRNTVFTVRRINRR